MRKRAREGQRARGRAHFTGACLAEGVAPSGEGDNDGQRANRPAPTSLAKAKRPMRKREKEKERGIEIKATVRAVTRRFLGLWSRTT